jgi:predicted ester cyclase
MTDADLPSIYGGYISCLNRQDWDDLGQFVHEEVEYKGERVGLAGYRAMLERDYREIPDLRFNVALLVSDPSHVAARLAFRCAPTGMFLGLPVNGRRVSFTENVFYRFRESRIHDVWSIIDKAAIEAQLHPGGRQENA